MKIHVDVTQEDIDQGCRVDLIGVDGGCMVWRAFQRTTEGSFPLIRVEWDSVEAYANKAALEDSDIEGRLWRAEFQPYVTDRIKSFDEGDRVEPFAFDIDLPI